MAGNIDPRVADRIRGTLLASACGNSLGGAALGMTRREIMLSAGLHGVNDFMAPLSRSIFKEYQPGQLLSDTLLALALSDSLLSTGGNLQPADFKSRIKELLQSEEFLASQPGSHCLLPLRQAVETDANHNPTYAPAEAPTKEEEDCLDANSTHVSAAVRAYPAGLLPPGRDIQAVATAQAGLTHHDLQIKAASAVLAHSVSVLVQGHPLATENDVRQYVHVELDMARKLDPRFADYWDGIAPDLDYEHQAQELPYSLINVESAVSEAVPTAVGIFLIFRHNLEEAVTAAASAGGDTDTVAAIVGALSGAYHGAAAIPERWLKQISHRDRLEAAADKWIELWSRS